MHGMKERALTFDNEYFLIWRSTLNARFLMNFLCDLYEIFAR